MPKFQVTMLEFVLLVAGTAAKNVTPAGNESVTITLLADDGPKFVTKIV